MCWTVERELVSQEGCCIIVLGFKSLCINPLNAEMYLKKLNSVALVRGRSISTERPPLVGEVSANFLFLWIEGVAWSAQRIPKVVNFDFLDRSRYFSFQVAPQLFSRG
jgi:hypothetical protein